MIVQTQVQPLRASEVLREVHCGDKVLYRWEGQEVEGIVGGWKALSYGRTRQHLCLIFRRYHADREVPLADIIGRL